MHVNQLKSLGFVKIILGVGLLCGVLVFMSCGKTEQEQVPASTTVSISSISFEGQWEGILQDPKAGRIPVKLIVGPAHQSGEDGGDLEYKLSYEAPRSCNSFAIPAGAEGDTYFFRFTEASGGSCDNNTNGEMTVQRKSGDTLDLHIKNSERVDEFVTVTKK